MANTATQIIISAKDETKQAFDSVRSGLGSLSTLATAFGVAATANIVRTAANFSDEMGKAAQKVGLTTESLSKLKYAADLSDVAFEGLQTGVRKLSSNLVTAAQGGKDAKEAFALAGIQIRDTAGNLKASDVVLAEIADRFASMPDGVTKTALAVKLFGKSGADLIPLLNSGSDGLRDMGDEAERFGLVIDQKAAKAAENFNDNVTRLGSAIEGLKITASGPVIGALADLTTELLNAGKAAEGFWGGFIGFMTNQGDYGQALTDVQDRLVKLRETRDGLSKNTIGNKINNLFGQDLNIVNLQIAAAEKEEATLKRLVDIRKKAAESGASPKPAGSTPAIEDGGSAAEAAKAAQTAADQRLALFRAQQEDLARTIQSFQTAARGQEDPSERLQRELDAYSALFPPMQEYLQSLVDITRQKELQDRQDTLAAASDARELAMLEEQSSAEQEALDKRNQGFEDYANQLLQEQEDLNIGLIASDKSRAAAQLALDHERAVARIQNMELELEQAQQLIDQETANYQLRTKQVKDGKNAYQELQTAIDGYAKSSAQSLADFAFGTESSFSGMVDSILKDLARLAIQKSITEPIINSISGGFDGSSGIGSFFASFFGGGRAKGGSVDPSQFYMVGEKGPELFIPNTAGTIIPNDFSGGGASTTISVSVDATGSKVSGDSGGANELGKRLGAAVRNVLIEEKRPGGLLA